jgi:hypothetical protein
MEEIAHVYTSTAQMSHSSCKRSILLTQSYRSRDVLRFPLVAGLDLSLTAA